MAKEFKGIDITNAITAKATGANTTAYAIYTTGGTSEINIDAGVKAESVSSSYGSTIAVKTGDGNNTINILTGGGVTAESTGGGDAYGIRTGTGDSAINILADVAIAATAAGGTAIDILLGGADDTLNFAAPSYNRKIVVSGAEKVNFAGASSILQGGSSFGFTGSSPKTVTVGPNAKLTVQGGVTFTGASTVAVGSGASLNLLGDIIFSGAAFSAASGSTLDFGKVGAGLASLDASTITLDEGAAIKVAAGIADNNYHFLKAANGGFSVNAAFIDKLNGLGGSASQDWKFSQDVHGLHLAIANRTTASSPNIIHNLNTIGVQRPGEVVTGSFAEAIFDFTKSGTTVISDGSSVGDAVQDAMYLLAGNASPNGVITALSGREGDAVTRALSGASDAVVTGIFNHTAFAGQRLISARLGNVRTALNQARSLASSDALASAILNAGYSNRFWVSGLGLWEDADPREGDLGYEVDSGGFMTGFDRVFGPVVAGGFFGYTRGSFKDKAALANDSDIDSYSFNLYATLNHCSGLFAGVTGGYQYSDFDLKRVLIAGNQRHEGKYHANTWSLGTQAGYDWKPVENLTPSLGLTYLNSRTGGISQTYTTIDRLKEDAVQMPLDLEVRYDLSAGSGNLVSLKANAGYAYNFKNDGAEGALSYNGIVNSPRVNVQGRTPGRHTLNLGAGAKATFGRFEAGLEYDYHAKKDYDAHRLMGTFGVSF